MKLLVDEVQSIALYTGDYGYNKCICKCPNCNEKYLCGNYQANITQVYEVIDIFKNLKQVHLIGNPDPFVDVEFCNAVSKILVSHNIDDVEALIYAITYKMNLDLYSNYLL